MHYGLPKRLNFRGKMSERFYVRIYDRGRSTWKCTQQTTIEGARIVRDEWALRAMLGTSRPKCREKMEALIEDFKAIKAVGAAPKYIAHIRSSLAAIKRELGQKEIGDIAGRDLERFIIQRSQGLAPSTVCAEITQIKAFFKWCYVYEFIERDPSMALRRPRIPEKEIRTLTDAEVTEFLRVSQEAGPKAHGWILALVTTGFRTATVSRLRPEHIDFERATWRIPAELMKSKRDYAGRPVAPVLLEWVKTHPRFGYMFPAVSRTRFRTLAAKAGVSWCRPHDLRRTFVTRCREHGLDLDYTRWLSDHADLGTLLDRYRQCDPEVARAHL